MKTSPKLKILLISGIMAVFGLSVSIAIIAIGGGFASPVSIFKPPTSANLWTIGKTIRPGTLMNYSLTRIGSHDSPWSSLGEHSSLVNSSVTMKFDQEGANNKSPNVWKVILDVINGTRINANTTQNQNGKSNGVVLMSKQQLTNAGPIVKNILPLYEAVESSILEIRDIALQPQYLVIGAEWNSISTDVNTIPVKVTSQQNLQTKAGTFNTYILSYTLGPKTSRIWITPDLPLPIRAEVYNSQGQLQYKYDLISYKK
ncbi:MAG TPA: hypothetical protein VH796_08965 [Nitrososphaeraceae archaeon]